MRWDGNHRLTDYQCNFCDAKQTTIDHELNREAEGKHPLCELGIHEWSGHCLCYHDPNLYCARFCGEIKIIQGRGDGTSICQQ